MPDFGGVFIPKERIEIHEMTERAIGRYYSRWLAVVVMVVAGIFGVFNSGENGVHCENDCSQQIYEEPESDVETPCFTDL